MTTQRDIDEVNELLDQFEDATEDRGGGPEWPIALAIFLVVVMLLVMR